MNKRKTNQKSYQAKCKCNFCKEADKLTIEEKIEIWKYKKWCEETAKEKETN